MTAPADLITSADALARLDDGIASPADLLIADLFEKHCQWGVQRCLVCNNPSDMPECDGCAIEHDALVHRSTDV